MSKPSHEPKTDGSVKSNTVVASAGWTMPTLRVPEPGGPDQGDFHRAPSLNRQRRWLSPSSRLHPEPGGGAKRRLQADGSTQGALRITPDHAQSVVRPGRDQNGDRDAGARLHEGSIEIGCGARESAGGRAITPAR
jgi:hypothetical protein